MVEFKPDMKLDGQRAVEYPWVAAVIDAVFGPEAKPWVLVVGAAELYFDPVALWAPRLRYTDARLWPQPGAPGEVGNAADVDFGNMHFDVVHNISNLEHFGSGEYGVPYRGDDLDLAAVRNLNRFVRVGGVHLVSVPFGCPSKSVQSRMYDAARIVQLREAMLPLVPLEERYMGNPRWSATWQYVTPEYLADKPYHHDGVCGGFGVYLGAYQLPPMKWKAHTSGLSERAQA